jgi:hypothetical protein
MAAALGMLMPLCTVKLSDNQLHYIPVSQLYSEIYNIHAYFSGPSKAMTKALNGTTNGYQASTMSTRRLDGDTELRKIASAGREWMFKHGRKIDMESE